MANPNLQLPMTFAARFFTRHDLWYGAEHDGMVKKCKF